MTSLRMPWVDAHLSHPCRFGVNQYISNLVARGRDRFLIVLTSLDLFPAAILIDLLMSIVSSFPSRIRSIEYTINLQMAEIEKLIAEHKIITVRGDEVYLNPELERQMLTFVNNIAKVPDNDVLAYFAQNTTIWSAYAALSATVNPVYDDILLRLIKAEKSPEDYEDALAALGFINCTPFTYKGKTYNICLKTELEKYEAQHK